MAFPCLLLGLLGVCSLDHVFPAAGPLDPEAGGGNRKTGEKSIVIIKKEASLECLHKAFASREYQFLIIVLRAPTPRGSLFLR